MGEHDLDTGNQPPQGAGLATGGGNTGTSVINAFNGVKPEEKMGAGTQDISTAEAALKDAHSTAEDEHFELKAWGAQLSKELKENKDVVKALSKFEDISALANSYIELEKKLGSMQTIPGEKATKEELDAFYKKLGKPDSADKYGFKQEWEAEKRFAQAAYEANLSDAQAKALYDFIHKIGSDQEAQIKEAVKKQALETDAALKKEFGSHAEEKIGNYTKALKAFGNDEVLNKLEETGLAFNADFVKMFIKIGEALGESRTVVSGGSVNAQSITPAREGGTFSFFAKE